MARMTKQEREEWDDLYSYVKKNILGYDENQSLSRNMVLRLKGLTVNKFMENKNQKDTAHYPYSVILNTFKFCCLDIQKGFATHSFSDENHKFNYILKIVESNINNVYNRMQTSAKAKETTQTVDVDSVGYEGANYQRKTEKTSSRLKNLW